MYQRMDEQRDWRQFWERKSAPNLSDFEFDRGTLPRDPELEQLVALELLDFIDPHASDVVLDAGCGTGVNIILLHSRVRRVLGLDYAAAAVTRCQKRLAAQRITNAEVSQGDITATKLPPASVDRIVCMSVLQYVDDNQVQRALREFARLLRPGGTLILHVKNLSSLYLSTLWIIKQLLLVFGRQTDLEYFRTFGWYMRELRAAGFTVETYRSLNLLNVERMPRRLMVFLQRLELSHWRRWPFTSRFVRRHGSDLKLRARLAFC
jgi:ubiquinone/menaquinone biosynthesis C-methylase UbiE